MYNKVPFKVYRKRVKNYTNYVFKKYQNYINPLCKKRSQKGYTVDHILSIKDGFKLGISPEIIASPVNLQMLPYEENQKKGRSSYFTKEQLLRLYKQFNMEMKKCHT